MPSTQAEQDNLYGFFFPKQNKLIYTEIFAKYTELIEGYLDRRLKQTIHTFSMPDFMEMLM